MKSMGGGRKEEKMGGGRGEDGGEWRRKAGGKNTRGGRLNAM